MTEQQKRPGATDDAPVPESEKAVDTEQKQASPSSSAPPTTATDTNDPTDDWQIGLIGLVHYLSAYFMDVRYWEGIQTEKDTFGQLVQTLDKLVQMPDNDGSVLIRYRGFPSGSRASTKQDYVVLFGGIQIDRNTAAIVIKRQGLTMSHLGGRLGKAYSIFAEHGIRNLYLKIPAASPAEHEHLKMALHLLSRYPQAIKSDAPIVIEQNGQSVEIPLVKDENDQPDPNLTLVAGLNRLSAEQMQSLVSKVAELIQRGGTGVSGEQQTTVYNALFQIDSLKEQLIRPPLEMNNLKWQVVGRGEKVVESEDLTDLESTLMPGIEDQLTPEDLPSANLDESAGGTTDSEQDAEALAQPAVAYDPHDHESLAEHFGVEVDEVKTIVDLVDSCFDTDGRFLRREFEQNIPAFAHHEKNVFELLWNYLKGTHKRSDRVAFLSSLQLLISRLEQPKRALRILLTDFCETAQVSFSDRNALMLSNLMLRKYNKEVNFEIEITPEEVLLVKDGLDASVAEYGMWCIEGERTRFLKKMHSIRDQVIVALDPALGGQGSIPLHYLLSLEREVYIFLALVQGETGYMVMREALEIYGNPANPVYTLPESGQHLQTLLQHLKILLRGFGRMADRSDLDVFDDVGSQEAEFSLLGDDQRYKQQVVQVMEWVDRIKASIQTAK